MKKYRLLLLYVFTTVFTACSLFEGADEPSSGEVTFVKGGQVLLSEAEIDYYDSSTHIIYLNNKNRFKGDFTHLDGAKIIVQDREVYTLSIHSPYYSYTPTGPHIFGSLDQFGDHAFRISFMQIYEPDDSPRFTDVRKDPGLMASLKSMGKLRAGLGAEISSVETISPGSLRVIIKLTNNDDIDYYHLDPEKMGFPLFHYFTNGLIFFDKERYKLTYPTIPVDQPKSPMYWSHDWLSVIRGKASKNFELVYDNSYEDLPLGQELSFNFDFPGLSLQITDRNDLNQAEGRIWLGKVSALRTLPLD